MSYVGNRAPGQAFATHAAIDFLGGVDLGDVVEVEGAETTRRGRTAVCDATLTVGDEVVATFRGATLRVRD